MLRVLLVCTGNICRSPIAHGLLADRSSRVVDGAIEVRSSGTWARGGSRATREAVSAANELGIDIAGHRATPFSAKLADWADLIVTMTLEQAAEVAEVAPDAVSKTFTLKEVVPLLEVLPPVTVGRQEMLERVTEANRVRAQGRAAEPAPPELTDPDVSDPLGLSEIVYQAVAAELTGLIDRLVRGLVGRREYDAAHP